MLSRLRNLLPFQTSTANRTEQQSTDPHMPFITGSQPWLKPYILAALAHPPKPPALNAHYLQAVSPVSSRRELTVFDGHFLIPAVLSQSAASLLDADEDDTGVTTRNLLGHVLAPVSVLVVPDMTTTPPTGTLLIKELRVFADRVHQRPPGRVPLVYTDLDVCDALRAIIGRHLASYATATVLERADRAAELQIDKINENDSDFEQPHQDSGLPPPGLLSDSEIFAMRANRGTAPASGGGEDDDPEPLEIIPEDPTPPEPSQSNHRDPDWDIKFTQDPAEAQGDNNPAADYLPQTQHFAVDDDDEEDDDDSDIDNVNQVDEKDKDSDFDIKGSEVDGIESDGNEADAGPSENASPSANKGGSSAGEQRIQDIIAGAEDTISAGQHTSPTAKTGGQLSPSKERVETSPRTPERRSLRSDDEKLEKHDSPPLKQSRGSPKGSPAHPLRRSPRNTTPKSSMQIASDDENVIQSGSPDTNEDEEGHSNLRRSPRISKKQASVLPSLQIETVKNTQRRPRSPERSEPEAENDGVLPPANPENQPEEDSHGQPKGKETASANFFSEVSRFAKATVKQVLQTRILSPSRKVGEKENVIGEEKSRNDTKLAATSATGANKKQEVHKMSSQPADTHRKDGSDAPQSASSPHPKVILPSAADHVQTEPTKRGVKRKAHGSTSAENRGFHNPMGEEDEPINDNPEPFLDKLRAEMEEMRRFRDRINKNPDGYKTDPDGFLPSGKSARHSAKRRLVFPEYPPPTQSINRALDVPESAPI